MSSKFPNPVNMSVRRTAGPEEHWLGASRSNHRLKTSICSQDDQEEHQHTWWRLNHHALAVLDRCLLKASLVSVFKAVRGCAPVYMTSLFKWEAPPTLSVRTTRSELKRLRDYDPHLLSCPPARERRELAAVRLLRNMLEEGHAHHDLVPPAKTTATERTLRNVCTVTRAINPAVIPRRHCCAPNSNTYTEQQTNPSSRSRETAADRNVSNHSKPSSRKDISFPGGNEGKIDSSQTGLAQ
ncbi:hypothetical protein Bbelb_160730 [Branchiostoma belcheri]|nr:hypothetical protein Bbelb_160730 [Branchiostoma belcheri]